MPTIIDHIESAVARGTVIPKPLATGDFLVKGWGVRRRERALIYTIPNHKRPSRPYEKGITVSEWEQAFEHLTTKGEFDRAWFNDAMTECAKEGDCNFTTIGGILQLLGYCKYTRGSYRGAARQQLND